MSLRSVLGDNRPSWHNPKVLGILLLVFFSGFAGGVLTTKLALGTVSSRAATPAWQEGGRELTIEMLRKELALTPEQAAEVETVLDDFVVYYKSLQIQMDDWRIEGKKRILRVLGPEQKKKFERIMQQMQRVPLK